MSRPGMLFAWSKITSPSLTPDLLRKWYDMEHIPDIIRTSGFKSDFRYEAISPGSVDGRSYLNICIVDDLVFFDSDEFKAIPIKSELFAEDKSIFDLVDFDLRYAERVDVKTASDPQTGRGRGLLIESIGPAGGTTADIESWFEGRHLDSVQRVPGYRRTTRYNITFSTRQDCPSCLALHEFDSADADLAEAVRQNDRGGSAIRLESAFFRLVNSQGEVDASL
ncbi:MAG: hypothetical protein M1817_004922 [Caeruleum heppii]|nr:MAG: hypothetical protein M1817_004922 [Caeruleum heppii]